MTYYLNNFQDILPSSNKNINVVILIDPDF